MKCFVKNKVFENKLVRYPRFLKTFHQGSVMYTRLRTATLNFIHAKQFLLENKIYLPWLLPKGSSNRANIIEFSSTKYLNLDMA